MNSSSPVEGFLYGFLPLFYLVSPRETSFETLDQVPKYVLNAVPYFFILIFIEVVVRWLQGLPKVRLNDSVISISSGMIMNLCSLVIARSIELTIYLWVYENWRFISLHWDSLLTWTIGFLGIDCGYYWAHRMAHEVNLFWAAHQVHHSSEEYNLSTALRQSALQRYTTSWFYIPLALIGMPPTHYMVHKQLNLIYQFWIHTECIGNMGPLEYILNTPSHHRVHHGRNRYCVDKNYAGVLIIWDRMFGTFQPEEGKIYYGLVHSLNSFNPFWAQIHHLVYIAKSLWSMDGGISKRVNFLFKGPGWSPGKPRLGNPNDILEIPKDIIPYHRTVPMWIDLYVMFHFTLLLIGGDFIARKNSELPYLVAVGAVLYIIFSLTSIGMMYDHHRASPFIEVLRLLCALSLDYWYTLLPSGILFISVRVMFLASVAVWCLACIKQIQEKKQNIFYTYKEQ